MTERSIEPGAIFRVPYPFVRSEYEDFEDMDDPDEHGRMFRTIMRKTWKPGTEEWGEDAWGRTYAYADAMGEMILEVVSTHKPGRFPTRVFYTRKWITPDGKEFGKPGCRVCVMEKFRRMTKGYAWPVRLDDKAPEVLSTPAYEKQRAVEGR